MNTNFFPEKPIEVHRSAPPIRTLLRSIYKCTWKGCSFAGVRALPPSAPFVLDVPSNYRAVPLEDTSGNGDDDGQDGATGRLADVE